MQSVIGVVPGRFAGPPFCATGMGDARHIQSGGIESVTQRGIWFTRPVGIRLKEHFAFAAAHFLPDDLKRYHPGAPSCIIPRHATLKNRFWRVSCNKEVYKPFLLLYWTNAACGPDSERLRDWFRWSP